jgi:flagellin-like hook-associated protein FlgL
VRAQYEYSSDGGTTWSGPVTVNTGGADGTADITIDGTNNTFYRNGTAINLTAGTYTGDSLATEIQAQLNAVQGGHVVSYNATERKFTITNGTGTPVGLDWSNPGSTASGVLGFDTADSWLGVGEADVSDESAGMFVDGAGVVNATNRGVKISFGTSGTLASGDTFEIKDYSIFEMVKNLRDALEVDDLTWTQDHIAEIDDGLDVIRRNTSYVGTNLRTMDNLTEANKARQDRTAKVISETMDADLAQLAAEYNNLSTVYQSLMYSFTKIQELGLLNFLK